ncbi:MAG: hypothetical protein WDW38_000386 [Sanguina aurantia]
MSRNAQYLLAMAAHARAMTSGAEGVVKRKVAILGAAGGIGQSLSLLMKMNPLVTDLALYDIGGTPGVAADVSHVNTGAQVKGYEQGNLAEALRGADLVIMPAGVPRKPGMTRDDLFNINAGIVKGLVEGIAKHAPGAVLNIISNPVNSTVPIAAETLKRLGVYDKRKLMGVTTLDVVRAKTFYAELKGLEVGMVDVPVVGGHAGITILPLFSQAGPTAKIALTDAEITALTKRTQEGGTEVVLAKAGKGSATLSMAYAAALFADSVLHGLNGHPCTEYSYVDSTVTSAPYFASKVKLSTEGVEKVFDLGEISEYEKAGLAALLPDLIASIEVGLDYAKKQV